MTVTVAHIVALAARTPVGLTAESTAAAIRAAVSRISEHPIFADAQGAPILCGRDPLLAPTLIGPDRFVALARAALREITGKLAGLVPAGRKIPLLLALPEPRPGFADRDLRGIPQALASEDWPGFGRLDVHPVGQGHAGGFRAIEQALAMLGAREELCIVGGVDSYLDGATLDWLEETRRLACTDARGGFPPGEGAAFVAVASEGLRRHKRLTSWGQVRGVACAIEKRDPDSDGSLMGEALTQVFEIVGAQLRRPQEVYEGCYCDSNGERVRDYDLAFALLRRGELFRDGSAYVSPVSAVGDQGAATMPLNCVLATRAWARGYARGPNALVFGGSWKTGTRGALLLQRSA